MGVKVFCKQCGKANEREQEVCSSCGVPLSASPQTKVMKAAISNVQPPKGLEKGGSTMTLKPSDLRPVYVKCPQCSQVSRGSSKFCNKCGSKLENAPAADAVGSPPPHASAPSPAAPEGPAGAPPAEAHETKPAPASSETSATAPSVPPVAGPETSAGTPGGPVPVAIPRLKITRGPTYFLQAKGEKAPDAAEAKPTPADPGAAAAPAGPPAPPTVKGPTLKITKGPTYFTSPAGASAETPGTSPAHASPAKGLLPGFTAKIDRIHRKSAHICEECGVLNVGYEQCVECGVDLRKPVADKDDDAGPGPGGNPAPPEGR
jgi:ribosomal protein L37E